MKRKTSSYQSTGLFQPFLVRLSFSYHVDSFLLAVCVVRWWDGPLLSFVAGQSFTWKQLAELLVGCLSHRKTAAGGSYYSPAYIWEKKRNPCCGFHHSIDIFFFTCIRSAPRLSVPSFFLFNVACVIEGRLYYTYSSHPFHFNLLNKIYNTAQQIHYSPPFFYRMTFYIKSVEVHHWKSHRTPYTISFQICMIFFFFKLNLNTSRARLLHAVALLS